MRILESFNFDIIIILILISSIFIGAIFNLFKQGRKTLVLILPFVILFFWDNLIYNGFKKNKFLNNLLNWLINFLKIDHYQETAFALIVYFLSYLILGIIIWLIYSLFRGSVQNRVLRKPKLSSRFLSSLLGALNGYVLGMLFIFFLAPFISLDYNKPITSFYLETANDLISFSNLNKVQNVNVENYLKYENVLGELTGRNALNYYDDILVVFEDFSKLELELSTEILPNLNAESRELIDSSDLINSFSQNLSEILKIETDNPLLGRMKDINLYIVSNIVLLNPFNSLLDYSFPNLYNYLLENYDLLLEDYDNKREQDEFRGMMDSFNSYVENKDEYLSLLDYESLDIETDVLYFEKQLNSSPDSFIEKFQRTYSAENLEFNQELNFIFEQYLDKKVKIDKLEPNLSLSIKIVLSDNYDFEKNILVKSYLSDAITSLETMGYKLYSEYIFFTELTNEVDTENLDQKEFIKILINLDKIVAKGLLTEEQAMEYCSNLFSKESRLFFGLLDQDLIKEIGEIENKYLKNLSVELDSLIK